MFTTDSVIFSVRTATTRTTPHKNLYLIKYFCTRTINYTAIKRGWECAKEGRTVSTNTITTHDPCHEGRFICDTSEGSAQTRGGRVPSEGRSNVNNKLICDMRRRRSNPWMSTHINGGAPKIMKMNGQENRFVAIEERKNLFKTLC